MSTRAFASGTGAGGFEGLSGMSSEYKLFGRSQKQLLIIFIKWSMKPLFLELQNLSIVMKRMNIILFVMDRFSDGACFKADYEPCRQAPFLSLAST